MCVYVFFAHSFAALLAAFTWSDSIASKAGKWWQAKDREGKKIAKNQVTKLFELKKGNELCWEFFFFWSFEFGRVHDFSNLLVCFIKASIVSSAQHTKKNGEEQIEKSNFFQWMNGKCKNQESSIQLNSKANESTNHLSRF